MNLALLSAGRACFKKGRCGSRANSALALPWGRGVIFRSLRYERVLISDSAKLVSPQLLCRCWLLAFWISLLCFELGMDFKSLEGWSAYPQIAPAKGPLPPLQHGTGMCRAGRALTDVTQPGNELKRLASACVTRLRSFPDVKPARRLLTLFVDVWSYIHWIHLPCFMYIFEKYSIYFIYLVQF